MGFEKLTETGMEKLVGNLVGEGVSFQMEDAHAYYFDGTNGQNEYKVVVDQEELSLEERKQGKEDWYPCFGVNLTDELNISMH